MYNNVMPLLIQPSSWPQALLAVVTWTLSDHGYPAWLPCPPLKRGTNEEFVTGQRAEHLRGLALSLLLPHLHTHIYTQRDESGPSCESENHPRDLIHPCFCVSGQPHRSCLHFSNITGFSTAQRPGSPTGPLGASAPVFSRAHDEIYV